MRAQMRRYRLQVVLTLLVGYMGFYFCRSFLSVINVSLGEHFGVDKDALGALASLGVLLYAVGKLVNGTTTDFLGGRRVFVFAMMLSAAATAAFGASFGFAMLFLWWGLNRFVQSAGWGALVKIASAWFEAKQIGTAMAILSLSYPLGDFFAKLSLGMVLDSWGWRAVCMVAAALLALFSALAFFTLKEHPMAVGLPPVHAAEDNLFGRDGQELRPQSLKQVLSTYLRSGRFLLVALMSFGLTAIRETFAFWTPTYLVEVCHVGEGTAAQLSSAFPFFGAVSVLAAGIVSDRLAAGRRGGVMFVFLTAATIALVWLSLSADRASAIEATVLVSVIGLLMTGPYAFLAGAMAVDMGGKAASSSAAGLADAVGYLGGALSGVGLGAVATRFGWSAAFWVLCALCASAAIAAAIYRQRYELTFSHDTAIKH